MPGCRDDRGTARERPVPSHSSASTAGALATGRSGTERRRPATVICRRRQSRTRVAPWSAPAPRASRRRARSGCAPAENRPRRRRCSCDQAIPPTMRPWSRWCCWRRRARGRTSYAACRRRPAPVGRRRRRRRPSWDGGRRDGRPWPACPEVAGGCCAGGISMGRTPRGPWRPPRAVTCSDGAGCRPGPARRTTSPPRRRRRRRPRRRGRCSQLGRSQRSRHPRRLGAARSCRRWAAYDDDAGRHGRAHDGLATDRRPGRSRSVADRSRSSRSPTTRCTRRGAQRWADSAIPGGPCLTTAADARPADRGVLRAGRRRTLSSAGSR